MNYIDAGPKRMSEVPPFYFFLTVWGASHIRYLISYCIPSLLSPNNIPALRTTGRSKFLIACPSEDWKKISETPVFTALGQHVDVIWQEIPSPNAGGVNKYMLMSAGYKLATSLTFEHRAIGVQLAPDLMCSDGTVAAAAERIRNGAKVVLVASVRFAEEPLFTSLSQMSPKGWPPGAISKPEPIILPPRMLARAAVRSLHPETQTYEWECNRFAREPSACWWKVRNEEDAVLMYSLNWQAIAIDYREVKNHNTDTLDSWTIDGDYIYLNFGISDGIQVVQDSDELMIVSWSSITEALPQDIWRLSQAIPGLRRLIKGVVFQSSLASERFDPLKRAIFQVPVRWHGNDLSENWDKQERSAKKIINFYTPPKKLGSTIEISYLAHLRYAIVNVSIYFLRLWRIILELIINIHRITKVLMSAFSGDREAWKRVGRRTRIFWSSLQGTRSPVE